MRPAGIAIVAAAATVTVAALLVSVALSATQVTPVAVIGDSVSARIEQIPEAAYALENGLAMDVDTGVCRRLVEQSCEFNGTRAPSTLEVIRSWRRLPSVVVIDVGYNESTLSFTRGSATVMAALTRRGVTRVLWVTLRERQQSNADTNLAIRALAKRWPTIVRVVDWNAGSSGQPWFEQDGVHLDTVGAVMLARLIHTNARAACSGGCSLPKRPPLQPLSRAHAVCTEGAGGAWAAVLGTAGSARDSLALQRRAVAKGFGQTVIVQANPSVFEVVLFGFPTRAAAVGVYLEAKQRGFRMTIAPNIDNCGNESGSWKAVFGHTATATAARRLLARIRAAGFADGSQIQNNQPRDYEVVVEGIQSTTQFTAFAAKALKAGFIISFEPD